MNDDQKPDQADERQRKEYSPPVLSVFGSLAELTGATGGMSNLDGGSVTGMMRSQ